MSERDEPRKDAGQGGGEADLAERVDKLERRIDAVLLVLEGATGAISTAANGARRT